MRNLKLTLAMLGALALGLIGASFVKPAKKAGSKKFMQLTSIESLVSGGFARSKLIATNSDGSKIETEDLEHFYSLVGLKFENIMKNDVTISHKLEALSADGWELESTNSSFGTRQGCGSSGGGNGMIITRYLMSKTGD